MSIGATVGVAVLLAFGRPNRRPTLEPVTAALTASGLTPLSIEPFAVGVRGARWYGATVSDGTRHLLKVLSPDERSVDLLYRTYRYLRFKNVGDERPFSSLRRSVEHEALASLLARDVGVATPRMRAIAEVGEDSMLIAYEMVEAERLDHLPGDEVSDQFLRELWQHVTRLREHRIAHRDLRAANILVAPDSKPWITGFAFSEVAATDDQLDGDVAQLLAALSLTVGADRTVTSAVETLGTQTVGAALPRLQPNALSDSTRTAPQRAPGPVGGPARHGRGTVRGRRAELRPARTDQPAARVHHGDARRGHVLPPSAARRPTRTSSARSVTRNWSWVPLVVLFSALTYVGAALGVGGAVPARLRAVPTLLAQVAASFASNLAPAGVGGMALNVRYLRKSGVDAPVAASSVGLNAVAGFAVHLGLMLVFFVWAGRSGFSISLPSWPVVAVAVAVVVLSVAAAFAIRFTRKLLTTKLVPALGRALGGLAAVIRSPAKVALLFGGSATITLSYVLAMYFSTVAFGGDLNVAQVGAAYLAGSAIAAVAPTPGGLGALEAAVIAGLVGAGMPGTEAVPAVFLFRLATYWLPILPGWFSFNYLRRAEFV